MIPALLFPAALAALAALVVPLAVHLARNADVRRIDFAALRWLTATPRPRARPRFDEWRLLAARLALVAGVALWLARPAVVGGADRTPWLAVVPGADVAAVPPDAKVRRHWLAPGFPALDAPPPRGPLPVASLLRELDADLPRGVPLRVVVPAQLAGVDAERPRLSRAVAWQVVGGAMAAVAAPPTPVPWLSVRFAPARGPAVRYLRAAATAWAAAGAPPAFDAAPASVPLAARPAVIVWLASGPLPAAVRDRVAAGATALIEDPAPGSVVWRDAAGAALATAAPLGRGRIVRLTRRLDPAVLPQFLDPDFPHRLRDLLAPPHPAPARVAAVDHAPLTGAAPYPPPARDVGPWLALALAALFVAERWLATARRPRVVP